jgi:hypothetical protein
MRTAAVQAPVQEKAKLSLLSQPPVENDRQHFIDDHPFATVSLFIVLALAFASTFIVAVAIWLYQIQYSGLAEIKF